MRKFKEKTKLRNENLFNRKVFSNRIKSGERSLSSRKKPHKKPHRSSTFKIIAPPHIDFYSSKRYEKTNAFIQSLQTAIREASCSGEILNICFRNTVFITASAAINLFAETDRTLRSYPNAKFIITYPPKTKILNPDKDSKPIVDLVLNRIGFYSLLGIKQRKLRETNNVKCWEHASGYVVNGEVAASLLMELKPYEINISQLYRSVVEALANAVEHAYNPSIPSTSRIVDKRWWMFMSLLDCKLTIIICDLGHGIPKTLPKTQSKELLNRILNKIGAKVKSDCALIQASTLVKRTRTDMTNRGKGGKDLTSLVDNIPGSRLRIFSNSGVYSYKGSGFIDGSAYNNKTSINGTIVEWSIPLPTQDNR